MPIFANNGYREPSGEYFREFEPARLLKPAIFCPGNNIFTTSPNNFALFNAGNYAAPLVRPFTTINNGISESAYRYLWYKYDEYINIPNNSSRNSGIADLCREEPLTWRWMDYGPAGQFVKRIGKSVSYPYDDIQILFDGSGQYSVAPIRAGNLGNLTNDELKSLPWYQFDNIIVQIQEAYNNMFSNPRTNIFHPSCRDSYIPNHNYSGGISIPSLDLSTALQLNNLNLKPTGWLRNEINISGLLPYQAGYMSPTLDAVQQISFPYEYARNIHSLLHINNICSGTKNISCSGTVPNLQYYFSGVYDNYHSILYLGLLDETNIVITGVLDDVTKVFDVIYKEPIGLHTKTIQYAFKLKYHLDIVGGNSNSSRYINISKSSYSSSGIFPVVISTGLPLEQFLLASDIIPGHEPFYSGAVVENGKPFSSYYSHPRSIEVKFYTHWDLVHYSGHTLGNVNNLNIVVPPTLLSLNTNNSIKINDIPLTQQEYTTALSPLTGITGPLPNSTIPVATTETWQVSALSGSVDYNIPYMYVNGSGGSICRAITNILSRFKSDCSNYNGGGSDRFFDLNIAGIAPSSVGVGVVGRESGAGNLTAFYLPTYVELQNLYYEYSACIEDDPPYSTNTTDCYNNFGTGWFNPMVGQPFNININAVYSVYHQVGSNPPDCSGTVVIPIVINGTVGVACTGDSSYPRFRVNINQPPSICGSWW